MTSHKMEIFCVGCELAVLARLTNGSEIYPHRRDLAKLPFWKCDTCGNFVGCHHKTDEPTRPLGCIPTPELRRARSHIHAILDPIWKCGRMKRGRVYERVGELLGQSKGYHTAELRSVEQARNAYRAVVRLRREVGMTRKTGRPKKRRRSEPEADVIDDGDLSHGHPDAPLITPGRDEEAFDL